MKYNYIKNNEDKRKIFIIFVNKIVFKLNNKIKTIFKNYGEINKIIDKLNFFNNSIVSKNLKKVYYYGKS